MLKAINMHRRHQLGKDSAVEILFRHQERKNGVEITVAREVANKKLDKFKAGLHYIFASDKVEIFLC